MHPMSGIGKYTQRSIRKQGAHVIRLNITRIFTRQEQGFAGKRRYKFNMGKTDDIARHPVKNIRINAPAIRAIFQDKIL